MLFRATLIIGTLGITVPTIAIADGGINATYITEGLLEFEVVISYVVPLLVAIALAVFIWGVILFITQADDENARSDGRTKMIWGVIALFVIVSVWGLVALLNQLSGIEQNTAEVYAPQSVF